MAINRCGCQARKRAGSDDLTTVLQRCKACNPFILLIYYYNCKMQIILNDDTIKTIELFL